MARSIRRKVVLGSGRLVLAQRLHVVTIALPLLADDADGRRLGEPVVMSVRPSPAANAGHPVEWADEDPLPHKIPYGPAADVLRGRLVKLLAENAKAAGVAVIAAANHPLRLDFGSIDIAYAAVFELPVLPASSKQTRLLARQISESAVQYHASQILAAARLYLDWHTAWSREITLPRKSGEPLRVRVGSSVRPTAKQLLSLQRAVERGSHRGPLAAADSGGTSCPPPRGLRAQSRPETGRCPTSIRGSGARAP